MHVGMCELDELNGCFKSMLIFNFNFSFLHKTLDNLILETVKKLLNINYAV